MRREDFRKWAEHGCRQYGEDPWFFIRELAQNSRDADAGLIRVRAYRGEGGVETVEFEDDGTGMSLEHARRYLFRLYASSKEEDARSAGKYGIGFWSVLRYDPDYLLVESRTQRERMAVLIDRDFNLHRVECTLKHRGTRITLSRKARYTSEDELKRMAETALKRYCRFLRRNNRRGDKLPVIFMGKNLTRSMRLAGPLSLSFRDGPVEGAVGFAESPSVRLYARGLPVWKGMVLDELSHTEERSTSRNEITRGLAPVFLLNGNRLNVVMSRRAVIDDRELARIRRAARGAMNRLIHLHMEQAFPRGLFQRVADGLSAAAGRLVRMPPVYALAFLLIVLLGVVLGHFLPDLFNRPPPHRPSVLPGSYGGALVEDLAGSARTDVDLTYDPPIEAWFKILTADRYDQRHGFVVPEDRQNLAPLPGFRCKETCISVRFHVDRGGSMTVPMPSGYVLDGEALRIDGKPLAAAGITVSGDTVVNIPGKGGLLEYACGPEGGPPGLDAKDMDRLLALPRDPGYPGDVRKVLDLASRQDLGTRVLTALSLTTTLVTYDDSQTTAKVYRGLAGADAWLPFVIGAGKGDCDVMNGLNALFLRSMKVPSRLAIGLIGKKGKAIADLHAWTEYHDGHWRTVDATPLEDFQSGAAGEEDDSVPSADFEPQGKPSGPVPTRISLSGKPPAALEPTLPVKTAVTQPVRVKAPPPQWARGSRRTTMLLLAVSMLSTGAALLLAVFLVMQRRRWEQMRRVKDPQEAEDLLARMLSSASVHPRMWRHAKGLWVHRILPTLEGSRISLEEAGGLAADRRLFIGSGSNPLATEASLAGSCVLDRDHRAFGPFLSRLSGTIDLDAMEKLRPAETDGDASTLARLLETANGVLARSGTGPVRFHHAPGLERDDFRDIDLRTLSLPRGSEWPRCFIAVNAGGGHVKACCDLFEKNAPLAAFRLVEKASTDSLLLRRDGSRIRRIAARLLIEEAA